MTVSTKHRVANQINWLITPLLSSSATKWLLISDRRLLISWSIGCDVWRDVVCEAGDADRQGAVLLPVRFVSCCGFKLTVSET